MANSAQIYTIGTSAGSQRRILDAIRDQRLKFMPELYYSQRVKYSDFSAAATTEELDLHATFASNLIHENIILTACWIQRVTDFAGGSVSAATISIGDDADADELLTASDVFTGAKATAEFAATPGAAHWTEAFQWEPAYIPEALLTTTGGDVNTLTAGEFIVGITYRPIAAIA
jgi:uncharacterized cupin superfamily protein